MSQIKKDFSTLTIVTIPIAIVINIAIGQLVVILHLPLYLDSIGTVLVGVLAGPWAGALTGLLTNLIWGLTGLNPIYLPYAVVGAIIGLLAGLFSNGGWMRSWWKACLAGLITGLIAAIVSAPITAYLYGGVTGSGTDLVVAFFRSMGTSILQSSLAQGFVSDPLDKTITFLLVWLIVQALPYRFLLRYSRAGNLRAPAGESEPAS